MKRSIMKPSGIEIEVWDEVVWRAEVNKSVDGQYLTGYHASEADAVAEAEAWLHAPGPPEDLARIADMFEAAAGELRGARLHDGEVGKEQRLVLLDEAQRNVSRILEAVCMASEEPEWDAVMDALENLYSARRHGVDKVYHVDVLMEAFEGWRS